MICPSCEAVNKEGVKHCTNCGFDFENNEEPKVEEAEVVYEEPFDEEVVKEKTKTKKSFFEKETRREGLEKESPDHSVTRKFYNKNNFKLAAILTGVALIGIVIIFAIITLKGVKGQKLSLNVAGEIGKTISEAQKDLDIEFTNESMFAAVNDYLSYNYLYESTSEIVVDGVKMPEWVICVLLNDKDKIASINYYSFTSFENSYKGFKTSKKISLSSINKGDKKSKVTDLINETPYMINYASNGEHTYYYRYYYDDKADNEKTYTLSVVFENDKYVYSELKPFTPLGL